MGPIGPIQKISLVIKKRLIRRMAVATDAIYCLCSPSLTPKSRRMVLEA